MRGGTIDQGIERRLVAHSRSPLGLVSVVLRRGILSGLSGSPERVP
jgi:hypothetical protein